MSNNKNLLEDILLNITMDLQDRLIYYIEANGKQSDENFDKFAVIHNGDETEIYWDFQDIKKPSIEQLEALDMKEVLGKKERKTKLKNILQLETLTLEQYNIVKSKLKEGSLFILDGELVYIYDKKLISFE